MKWEYNVDPLQINDKRSATRILNAAASDGWEVVTIVPLPTDGDHVWAYVVYKRPVAG